jgi:hypothetical protein
VVVRTAEKPITALSPVTGNEVSFKTDSATEASDAKPDAILEAGLQVARQQLARAK